MRQEVTSTGQFWLPAKQRPVRISCRYEVTYERNQYIYRLLYYYEEPGTA